MPAFGPALKLYEYTAQSQLVSAISKVYSSSLTDTHTTARNSADSATPKLPAFYYLDNFVRVLERVYRVYDDLLSSPERKFYRVLTELPQESVALYVRLLSRKGLLFRAAKLNYPEITNTNAALQALNDSGLISTSTTAMLESLFPLFTKAEWLAYLATQGHSGLSQCKKAVLYERLRSLSPQGTQALVDMHETLLSLNSSELFNTFKLLYFGNGRQDLTDFVLRDLGLFQYENYRLEKNTRLFDNRAQIDTMLHYYNLGDVLENLSELTAPQLIKIAQQLPTLMRPQSLAERTINRRMQRLRITIARQLERLNACEEALAIYRGCEQAPSRERQVRIMHRFGDNPAALQLCEQLLESGSEAETVFAQQFRVKLIKALGQPVTKAGNFKAIEQTLFLAHRDTLSVEQNAAQYFASEGPCLFLENQLFLGLFGLVFWPVIFAEVRGAFSNEFQFAPHDLYHDDFLELRQTEFQQAWHTLENWHECPELCCRFFIEKYGIANSFVVWSALDETILQLALQRIPLAHWQCIFKRVWRDLRENRNGFPDLVHFPDSGAYQLIEIKGPGDRLQKNQNRWLAYFEQHNIPYQVVYVQWQ